MPEGPSIVIIKEKMQQLKLEGKKVLAVAGNTTIDKEKLVGQKLVAFKSWGKHLLISFKDRTLRIHFLMFGTYLINETKKTPLKLSLHFKDTDLNFYTCAPALIEGDPDEHYDWAADILSPEWDEKAALKKLKALPDTLVCDVLLDQEIFSGVGNIIKNEVLYRIKVHPACTIRSLPPAKLKALVKEASAYSYDFLKWKKAGTLKKNWLVYNKKMCGRCDLPIHKKTMGKTKRGTFFCSNCQKQY